MSFDESTAPAVARDCESEGSTGPRSATRPLHPSALLSWTLPPRLPADACADVERNFAELEVRYDAGERRAHAVWLRHLLDFGCCSIESLCEAFASPRPYLALQTLEIEAGQRLCEHLERIVAQHSLGGGAQWYPNMTVDLMKVSDLPEPILLVELDEPYEFSIDSLHRVPVRLARLVYESLQLLSQTLLPCMLPHELWRDQARFHIEEAADQFEAIRRAGGRRDITRAAKFVARKRYTDYFSTEPEELRQQLEYFTNVLYMQPPWMRELRTKRPIQHARRLLQRLSQYEIEHGAHPWVEYARHISQTVLAHFKDEAAVCACHRRVFRHLDQDFEEGVPLFYSLVLSSQSPIEKEHLQSHVEGLMNHGEHAVERFHLAKMAKKQFREIVELRATALGLLARAQAVNDQVLQARHRRRAA